MPENTGSGPYGSSAFGEVARYFTQANKRRHRKQLNEKWNLKCPIFVTDRELQEARNQDQQYRNTAIRASNGY
jgi:hypothetical protein